MTGDQWREVLSCYEAAVEVPADQRRRFLQSTTSDPEVLEKVLRMIGTLEENNGELTGELPPLEQQSRTGTRVGHYDLVAPLGQGGMGDVYKGWDTALDRTVALKFLRPEHAGAPAATARIVHEAKAASALNHPNIVTVYEVLEDGDSLVIVMEFVDGQSVRQRYTGPVPLSTLLEIGWQTALALAAAHANGIIHRDVKPENIMMRTDGYVKLLDFGLAHRIANDSYTSDGLPAGTLRYMSPEQISGEPLTTASDVFSLGLVLYELAVGRHPHADCNTLDGAVAIVSEPVSDTSTLPVALPPSLASLIAAMLSKEPGRRPSAADIAELLRGVPTSDKAADAARSTGTWPKPRLRLLLLAGVLGAIPLLALLWLGKPRAGKALETAGRPLTSQSGWEESPAFSPDGESIAFTWTPKLADAREIYTKRLNSGSPVRLSRLGSHAMMGALAWSSDGSRIAFKVSSGANNSGAIYAIPQQGGEETKLVDLVNANLSSSLDWSPDGTQLAFSDALESGRLAIHTFNLRTAEKRRLTTPGVSDWGDWDPTFSPDGRTLAFKRVRGYWLDAVYLMPAQGGPVTRITRDSAGIWGHAWMPDGRGMIVSTQLGGTVFGLWRFALTPGSEPLAITSGGLDAITPAGSRNRGRIAWVNRLDDTNTYRIPRTGGSPALLLSSTRRDESAAYSPDGRIAFASDRSGSWEIWFANAEGREEVRVTNFEGPLVGGPRWSPDGRRLLFVAHASSRSRVYLLDCPPGTSRCAAPERLTDWPDSVASSEAMANWSTDGSSVYFVSNRSGQNEIWKRPLAGAAAIQVTHNGGLWSNESRDGNWLYFAKVGVKGITIWRMAGSRAVGSAIADEEKLVIGPPVELAPEGWTLSGEEILFYGNLESGQPRALHAFHLGSGKIRTIVDLPQVPERGTTLSVSPDAKWLLYTQLDRSGSNIMVAETVR